MVDTEAAMEDMEAGTEVDTEVVMEDTATGELSLDPYLNLHHYHRRHRRQIYSLPQSIY